MHLAVLFDMDGVIFDSEPIHEKIFIEFASTLGFSVSPKEYQRFIGTSSVSQWRHMKEQFNLQGTPQELSSAKMEFYKEYLGATPGLLPIPGLMELLEDLDNNQIPFALASSNTSDVVKATLMALGLDHVFTTRVGGDDVAQAKPAPDIFLLAASKLGVPPEQCIVIEDSTNGIIASQKAGMKSIGFENPNSPGQDLSEADHKVDSISSISVSRIKSIFQ